MRSRTLFGLTSFERRIVLLCAGMELDGDFANSCAAAPGSGGNPWPSFGLALAAFPDAHWDALANHAPLRRWRLIEICGDGPLVESRLRIDERILFFLTGVWQLDERLASLVEPVRGTAEIAESQRVGSRSTGECVETGVYQRASAPGLTTLRPRCGSEAHSCERSGGAPNDRHFSTSGSASAGESERIGKPASALGTRGDPAKCRAPARLRSIRSSGCVARAGD